MIYDFDDLAARRDVREIREALYRQFDDAAHTICREHWPMFLTATTKRQRVAAVRDFAMALNDLADWLADAGVTDEEEDGDDDNDVTEVFARL